MKPLHAINRIRPLLLLALFAVLIAPLLPGGHARAQQALTATPTATPAPPAIPGNFSGKVTNNGIVLSWTVPAGGATSYTIHRTWPRHSKYDAHILYLFIPGSSTSFTDSDVAVAGNYGYQIIAYRDGLSSGWSGTLTVAVPESVIPTATGTPIPSTAAPTATPTPTATLTPTPTGVPPGFPTPTPTVTPTLTPTPTSTPFGRPTATPPATLAPPESATPTATATPTPTPANRGRRLSDGGAPELTATPTPASSPPVPQLTAQAGADAVELRWTEVSGAARYELMTWWDAGTGWQPIGGANLTGASYTHTNVTAGTTYYDTIRAVNAGGETSGWLGAGTNRYPSVTVSQGVPAGGTSTATPTPTTTAAALSTPALTATATEGGVTLRWGAVQGAARYELMAWWDAETGWQPIGGANLTGTSYTHTSVTAGTTYYYTIRAVNAAGGTSGWLGAGTNAYPSVTASQGVPAGGTSTVTPTPTATAARLSTPALTAAAAEGGVALRWGAVQGAVRYDLMTWWDAETGWQPIGGANLTGTSYTHTDVTAGTKYYYTIRAVNAAGGTSAWLLQYATAVPPR